MASTIDGVVVAAEPSDPAPSAYSVLLTGGIDTAGNVAVSCPVANRVSTSAFNGRDAATLAAGATFQGVGESVLEYGRAGIAIKSDNATDGTLTVEVSHDNVNWGGPSRTWANTSIGAPHMWNIVEQYFRVKYVNGSTEADNLSIQVQYSINADVVLGHQLDEVLTAEVEAQVVRSVGVGQTPNGTFHNATHPGIDDGNSSSTNLTVATSLAFTGAWSGIEDYAGITVLVEGAAGGTVAGTLQMQFSHDGLSVHRDISITDADVSASPPRTLGAVAAYFRVVYTAASDLTAFDIQTIYHSSQVTLVSRLDSALTGNEDVSNVRSVLVGQDDDATFRNVATTRDGGLNVSVVDADLGFHQIVTPGGSAKVANQTHLVGGSFGGVALNAIKYAVAVTGTGAQDGTGAGELSLDTGVTANSSVAVETNDVARFIPANYNTTHHAVTIPDGASYASNNSRKWGAFNAAAGTRNGVYFELDGGTWYVAHCVGGVTTRITRASWTGAAADTFPDAAVNANVYEIEYNAGSIIFRVNGGVMHRVNLTAAPYVNDVHLPMGLENVNSGGSTTDVSMKVRAAAIYTLGKGKGEPRPYYIAGTNAGVLVKSGAGHLGKVIFARNGAGGGDATILIYDALSATNLIGRIAIDQDVTIPIDYDMAFNTGLFFVVAGAGTLGTTVTFD